MTKSIKRVLLLVAAIGAISVPAAPAQATTCLAADPTVDYVVCQTVYPTAAALTCKVQLLCY